MEPEQVLGTPLQIPEKTPEEFDMSTPRPPPGGGAGSSSSVPQPSLVPSQQEAFAERQRQRQQELDRQAKLLEQQRIDMATVVEQTMPRDQPALVAKASKGGGKGVKGKIREWEQQLVDAQPRIMKKDDEDMRAPPPKR